MSTVLSVILDPVLYDKYQNDKDYPLIIKYQESVRSLIKSLENDKPNKELKKKAINNIEYEIKSVDQYGYVAPKLIQEQIDEYFKFKNIIYLLKDFKSSTTNLSYDQFLIFKDNNGYLDLVVTEKEFILYSQNLDMYTELYNFTN